MKNALKGVTAARVGALAMTTGSLVWTAYGIQDLLGAAGIPAIVAIESLYLTLHYAEIKGVGGKKTRITLAVLGWIAALALGAFLCVHAATEWGVMAAVPAAVPPLASKLLWWVDEQLIRRDSVDPTPEMKAAHAKVIREAEHTARMAEAGIKAEAAQEVARLKALGEVAMTRSEVMFQVDLDRLGKEDELRIRKPLGSSPAPLELPVASSLEKAPAASPVAQSFGFSSVLSSDSPPTVRADRVQEIKEGDLSIEQIKDRYGVGKSVAYALRKEATQ